MDFRFQNAVVKHTMGLLTCLATLMEWLQGYRKNNQRLIMSTVLLTLLIFTCGQNCISMREALAVTTEIASIIHTSPKCLAQFCHLQEELLPGSLGLKPLCRTRWTVRTQALNAVLMNYVTLQSELERIGEESCGEVNHKSLGILAIMERFTTYFGLKLSFLIFSAMEQLSKTLQYKDINAQDVSTALDAEKNTYLRRKVVRPYCL